MQNGPVMNRSCTDCICCLIFVAFVAGMTGTAAYGFSKGNPMLLLTAWDSDGNGCGYNETTKDFPYLYWPAPNYNINTSSTNPGDYMAVFKFSMCVKSCPTADTASPVQCKQPKKFDLDAPGKFKNCTYYPVANTLTNGPAFRYGSQLSKFRLLEE